MPAAAEFGKFVSLDSRRRRLAVEAAIYLVGAWFTVRFMPLRRYAGSLGEAQAPTEDRAGTRDGTTVAIGWAIAAVSHRLPWTSTCLMRAIAGQWMLRRRGIPGTVRLGVARDDATGQLLAHAWLTSGGTVLSGGAELSKRYAVVGQFTAEP